MCIHVLVLSQELDDSRVDVAGTGAHRQTVQRSEAHGGIELLPPLIAQIEEPLPRWQVIRRSSSSGRPSHLSSLLRNVLVAGAVEAVATDLVLLVILIRYCVHIVGLRHGLMECGIEYCDHRNIRAHNLAASLDAGQVRRIVKRCQRYAVLDSLEDLLGDDNAVREELAAVYNAVTYCVDLAHRGDDTLFPDRAEC